MFYDFMIKILADSGATKTDWFVCSENGWKILSTDGINASTMDIESIGKVVDSFADQLGAIDAGKIELIRFFGAGLVGAETSGRVEKELRRRLGDCHICFESDLEAASQALFPQRSGEYVAAILGTGSNSCLYRDGIPVRNIRPGGFIIGDEGSGAVLGKLLLSDYFKGLMPETFARKIEERFDLRYEVVVKNVYRGEAPSRYLASFAPILMENLDNDYVRHLVESNLRSFIERVLLLYGCPRIGVAGGLAYACKDILSRLGDEYGLNFENFVKSPVETIAGQMTTKQSNGI